MNTITMYDSVTASDIPRNAMMVGGYLNGTFRWSSADWELFPHAFHVGIATRADVDGDVLDVEIGDATPAQAPAWVLRQRRHGIEPVVYCNASTWPAVRRAFALTGVREPLWWIANFDNVAELIPGTVGKQYINPPRSGGHYDKSIVAMTWPGLEQHVSAFDAEFDFAMERMKGLADAGKTPKWALGKRYGDYGLIDLISAVHDSLDLVTVLRKEVAELRAIVESHGGVTGTGTISGTFTIGQ